VLKNAAEEKCNKWWANSLWWGLNGDLLKIFPRKDVRKPSNQRVEAVHTPPRHNFQQTSIVYWKQPVPKTGIPGAISLSDEINA
jgi:hypothetical protein